MPEVEPYDAIIIGSGQAGGPLSTALVKAGRRTVLVEREHIGGTCINEGCTPTKTMVASAQSANAARRAGEYGVELSLPIAVSMETVRRRKRGIVDQFRNHSRDAIVAGGVTILMGEARFVTQHEVVVRKQDGTEARLSAPLIVIDAGGRPATPKIAGIDSVPTLNSTSIMELSAVPDHLLVLGGGYVGVEFAQMFRRFGSRVTIVQSTASLLNREDEDVAAAVAAILREDGIEILLNAKAKLIESDGSGVSVAADIEREQRVVAGSHLLVATGRVPNTDTLDLPVAGIATDERGYVKVDDHLQTNVEGVYATGDIAGSPPFTHISFDDYRILKDNLIDGGTRNTCDRLVPYTVFIDPQLGRVGMTEQGARKTGRPIRVAKMGMDSVARALEVGQSRGFMKAVVDAETDHILGCAVLGMEGGEMMAMLEIAMMGNLTYHDLVNGIFAHPTLAEAFNNLFQSWM
ncbi:MAG TPA: mercuric reductase [Chloroflexota bacterium]|nr:mercuric reductase [Chloroflexota bacterium]